MEPSGKECRKGWTVDIRNFQEFVLRLTQYWIDHGCIWSQPYDSMMGAGTFHPHTFLKGIGPEPWRAVYVQPCRRPVDGRYGKSPYRFQHYYQLQVVLKPSPANIVDLFLSSLQHVGVNLKDNDVSLLEDDWKGPTLGAWGLGWEIRANGQEVSQFTYFQQLGGMDIEVVSGEITYGLERLYMYAKGITNGLDMPYNDNFTYGDVFFQNEFEFSHFNFKEAKVSELFASFDACERNVSELCAKNLILPAYDEVLKASHTFNLLDARGAISVSERQRFIGRVRECARQCAEIYRSEREKLGFPMLKRLNADPRQILQPLSLQRASQGQEQEKAVSEAPGADSLPYTPALLHGKSSCDVLFELGVEEMPPAFQQSAQQEIELRMRSFLSSLGETFANNSAFADALLATKAEIFVSSRRLAVQFEAVPCTEPDRVQEVWGPAERIAKKADGSLSPAGEGFLRKNGIEPATAHFREKEGGLFLYAEKALKGRDLPSVLAEQFKMWVESLSAPLMMRWLPESISRPFIRPVRWIVALADKAVVPLQMFGLHSGRSTTGLRILSPAPIVLGHANEFVTALGERGVKISWAERRQALVDEATRLAVSVKGRVRADEGLFDKCAGLSESPFVFLGAFDAKYLRLPGVLVASVLREHMNSFALETSAGELLPFYVGVAGYRCGNVESMVKGTQDVVVGRLEDGAFYYDGDLETSLAELRERLKAQLFQADMGTLWDKSERVGTLAQTFAASVPEKALGQQGISQAAFIDAAGLAGAFCKADLRTGCVQEFPDEMQGVMGGVLVSHQKPFGSSSEVIAKAIAEHYEPKSAQGALPSSPLGQVVALADKLDSLCLMMNHGAELKGNKDPFGLRRLAIGILRLLGMEDNDTVVVPLTLDEALRQALLGLAGSGRTVKPDTFEKVRTFLLGRLKASWRGQYNPFAVDAATANTAGMALPKARQFVMSAALALQQTGEGSLQEALVPYRRSRNLTADVPSDKEKKRAVDERLFSHDSERTLLACLAIAERNVADALASEDFERAFMELAKLGKPLASFFEGVMVLDKEAHIRENRLALLVRIRGLYESVADFSQVQV
jgi:glycyl-tRNA synthetase